MARFCRVSANRTSTQADLFEFELRQTFMTEGTSLNIDEKNYDQCQTKLKRVCSLLEGLSISLETLDDSAVQAYPRLYTLTRHLASGSGAINLVIGPEKAIFKLPQDYNELETCLRIVTECNVTLDRLQPVIIQGPMVQPLRQQRRERMWEGARVRKHVTCVLETLFKHFKCGTAHEVLIKLVEDPDQDSALPNLRLAFSPCPDPQFLQEAWCYSVHQDPAQILHIADICADLRQHMGQGKALMLLIRKYQLFGAWETYCSPAIDLPSQSSKESLHELIVKGFFKPLSVASFLRGDHPAKFNTKDKRELAVKLGFCLMNFFDADITSKHIYFLKSSKSNAQEETPYLSFGSKLPITSNPYNFQMGHPVLLCFAKLLLELHFGEDIDILIRPENKENLHAYIQLMNLLDKLQYEGSDPYVEAIRGCFVVHHRIINTLSSPSSQGTDADILIRQALYEEIVGKLELGFTQSIPRSSRKRQRSESPPPFGFPDPTHESRSLTIGAMEPKRTSPTQKRQCATGSLSLADNSDGPIAPGTAGKSPTTVHRPEAGNFDSSDWFGELEDMKAVVKVKAEERDDKSPRIKIAILDTGIDNQYSDEVRYYDFVKRRNAPCCDNSTKHGTHVFQLLRKVSEDAEFFVGRVWERNQATPDTPQLVSQAIDYAREVWKVDIIVLPNGFNETQAGIGNAIDRANMEKILTFAAPSNYGNLRDIFYPGRLYGHGKVICLFSTNAMGKSSTTKTFNPSPLETAAHRTFAILGEEIVLENTNEILNGTSYSTAIGAGIAARILDFSHHPRLRSRIKDIDDFRRVEGMLAIFGRMVQGIDNGYRCMAPWKICPSENRELSRHEDLERRQGAVFVKFKEVLEDTSEA
ncbi:hypothetical protein O1611_g68 [Lasiodiplodia mahajangana]|uniref:Uncharacterized protein n=1 Tax=Lasiodiplodia mahajangana TaxID=1108764 RepID=A0ACC2K186_9PEZI|nr:hypothetical protein O1611_g68 [Lasiodiplodia mahajangana]